MVTATQSITISNKEKGISIKLDFVHLKKAAMVLRALNHKLRTWKVVTARFVTMTRKVELMAFVAMKAAGITKKFVFELETGVAIASALLRHW